MSDWQVGDLAVCVDAGHNKMIETGKVYRVEAVRVAPAGYSDTGSLGLVLEGICSNDRGGGYHATRFRKIAPDKPEACEDEFVTLLKRGKVSA
jgi:hypothetical protein